MTPPPSAARPCIWKDCPTCNGKHYGFVGEPHACPTCAEFHKAVDAAVMESENKAHRVWRNQEERNVEYQTYLTGRVDKLLGALREVVEKGYNLSRKPYGIAKAALLADATAIRARGKQGG